MSQLRLAELMASLSLAIDLGTGQPMEWVIRSTLLGVRLAEEMRLSEAEQSEVYYLSLLRHIGCTANAHSDAEMFGDELQVAEGMTLDMDDMPAMLGFVLRSAGKTKPFPQRLQHIARLLSAGPGAAESNHTAHCEVAERLAAMLTFGEHTQKNLRQIYARWDGKGIPKNLKGESISLPARVIHIAQDAASFFHLGGLEMAVEVARNRSGRQFDPVLVDVFCKRASDLCEGLDAASSWDAILTAEPGAPLTLSEKDFDSASQAVADFTDLKSPFTLSHSRHVAEVAEAAARYCRLPESDIAAIRRAGLIHDIGRVGVSASIWGKNGALTDAEWERVRLHPYYTERIFTRAESLAPLGALASQHHERVDGSGYHRRLPGMSLVQISRLLAAADAYCAMTELRPHRSALSPDQAAEELRRESKASHLDAQAVDDVLSAAGHHIEKRRGRSTDLSEREIEVLQLMARGLTNKQMASQLIIAEKTVGHHVQHIYNKIGVSTRAAATLYAVQNELL
jgi:HD-GYP domain-containing protein (c-di-GMP phosphodiesterase class II)